MQRGTSQSSLVKLSINNEDDHELVQASYSSSSMHTTGLLSPASALSATKMFGSSSDDANSPLLSPSDASSRPSLDADSLSDASSVSDESEAEGPSLQMMGEDHVRKQKAKDARTQLGVAVPSSLPRNRVISSPPGRGTPAGSEAVQSTSPLPIPEQDKTSASKPVQEEAAWSPAMAFLSGLNSPFSAPAQASAIRRPAAPVEERIGPYILGPVIGHGGFSVIRKATSTSGVVAVKIVTRSSTDPSLVSSLENEIAIWSNLHHEYILPLFTDYRTDDALYLVSLYCPAGSLFDILRLHGSPGLPQDDVGTMFRQVVRGLRYLHEQVRLVHGDIKLENVLVDEMGACRIADFGLARYIPVETPSSENHADETPHSALPPHLRGRQTRHRNSTHVPGASTPSSLHHFPPGSLPYAAPELLLPPTRSSQHVTKSEVSPFPVRPAQDIWAVGCLLHALLFGRLPFVDSYEPRLQMKIVRGVWERSRSKTRSRARGSSRSRSRVRSSSRDALRFPAGGEGRRRASKSRSRDVKIGKGPKSVLRGCICVDVNKRWTAAKIDEVAWNFAWDDAETEVIGEDELDSTTHLAVSTPVRHDSTDAKGVDHPESEWLTEEGGDKLTSMPLDPRTGLHACMTRTSSARRAETLP